MSGLTAEQRAERRQGITATDMAAILGCHPYRTTIEVWLEKMGEDVPNSGDPDVREMGLELEAPIKRIYARRTRAALVSPGTLTHRAHAHHKATPDGLVWDYGQVEGGLLLTGDARSYDFERGLECKTHGIRARDEYGEPGTDEVPEHELIQCAWGMHVTELQRWDLAPLIDNRLTIFEIQRDMELEGMLVAAADRFWRDHVLARKEPGPDGSAAYSSWLRRRYQGHGAIVQADEATAAAIERLRGVRNLERQVAQQRAQLEQEIQTYMGEATMIECSGERITWKRNKDGQAVDWQAVARALAGSVDVVRSALTHGATPEEIIPALMEIDARAIEQHLTTAVPGARQFRVPRAWHKEEK
jgi:putative phage-type endonuclease